MAVLFEPSTQRALDANGNPLNAGKWYFYLAGSTTPATVYANVTKATALSNPVVSDASGLFVPVYLDSSVSYRAVLKTSTGTTLEDFDPYRVADTSVTTANDNASFALNEPFLVIDNAAVTTNDATYQTLDLSPYIPAGAVAVYVQVAVYMGTVNAGTGWALRAPGDLSEGIDGDGSYRWYPGQATSIYFTTREWIRCSADRKIEYRRMNPGGNTNYWKLVVWGYQ